MFTSLESNEPASAKSAYERLVIAVWAFLNAENFEQDHAARLELLRLVGPAERD
jgi:hypothetical protein